MNSDFLHELAEEVRKQYKRNSTDVIVENSSSDWLHELAVEVRKMRNENDPDRSRDR
ncbi:MAG: hypothetical protein NWF00_06670 [Candidatus Bathyarchaeota archaeon]|nr:hypothetical protein [Candidatus Bathyarchaeota archaeon]